jgi:NAD(P)H-binding
MYCNRILLIRCWTTIIATVTLLMATTTTTTTFSSALAMPQSNHHPTKKVVVVVSGAGGQTGQSLFRKLLARPEEFTPFGIVRSEASKQALLESGGVPKDSVLVADVTNVKEVQDAVQTAIASAAAGEKEDDDVVSSFAFCICSSAKPVPSAEVNPDTGRPVFSFPNGDPEVVDWMGQKNQIDACPPGSHVVICSTMGGTNPDHPLNNLGRKTNDDGTTSGGMIVQWKRKAEVYLMEQAPKLKYTIVHPGGLTNDPGGERELVVGVDDETTGTDSRSIPREDVAQVMLEALRYPEQYAGRSFDVRAKPVGDGTATTDFSSLLNVLHGKNCDYSLGATM